MEQGSSARRRSSIEDVIADLERRQPVFEKFCGEVHSHIEKCLHDENIPFQSIQWRVKNADKVRVKYLDPTKTDRYTRLDDLTDIAGLRVITYYEDDVDRVEEIVEQEFAIDKANSEDKRLPDSPETFTYHALHLVVSLRPQTLGARSHKHFAGIRGEVQITSILRHAWAEIEHSWYDMRSSFPPQIKRRFARLSALIDMADEEFVELREEWNQAKSSIERQVESGIRDIPLDLQSLRAFVEQDPTVAEVDQAVADLWNLQVGDSFPEGAVKMWTGLLKASEIHTIGKLREIIPKYRLALIEYLRRLEPYWVEDDNIEAPLGHGISVYHLSLMIYLDRYAAAHEEGLGKADDVKLRKALREFDLIPDPRFDVVAQAKIAHTVLKKVQLGQNT